MDFLFLVALWSTWVAIAYWVGGWVMRWLGRRWLRWPIALLIFLLPLSGAIVAILAGIHWANEVGTHRIFETVKVSGYLLERRRWPEQWLPEAAALIYPPTYSFIEHEVMRPKGGYSPPPPTEWPNGYLQWRLAPMSVVGCEKGEPETAGIFRWGEHCYLYTWSSTPVSRYLLEHGVDLESDTLAHRLGVKARCNYVREINSRRVLAHGCKFSYVSWLGWMGPSWYAPNPSDSDYRRLDVREVLVPVVSQN